MRIWGEGFRGPCSGNQEFKKPSESLQNTVGAFASQALSWPRVKKQNNRAKRRQDHMKITRERPEFGTNS